MWLLGAHAALKVTHRTLDNGGAVWALGLGALFAVDGLLISTGHRSMSSHARSHPLLTVVGLTALAVHLSPKE